LETVALSFWSSKRVVITGGSGFLGSFVVDALSKRNPAAILVPRSAVYDLRQFNAVQQLLADTKPDIIIHLAALVGGIGANKERPAEFLYDNLMMGVQLFHEAYRSWGRKVCHRRHSL
jgi:GDP-L-fucose synthase